MSGWVQRMSSQSGPVDGRVEPLSALFVMGHDSHRDVAMVRWRARTVSFVLVEAYGVWHQNRL